MDSKESRWISDHVSVRGFYVAHSLSLAGVSNTLRRRAQSWSTAKLQSCPWWPQLQPSMQKVLSCMQCPASELLRSRRTEHITVLRLNHANHIVLSSEHTTSISRVSGYWDPYNLSHDSIALTTYLCLQDSKKHKAIWLPHMAFIPGLSSVEVIDWEKWRSVSLC